MLAAEHPELRIIAVDPGDMNTPLHQAAFPGEDIRPPAARGKRARLLPSSISDAPSGRYQANAACMTLASRVPRSSRPRARPRPHAVASRAGITHHRFLDLPDLLETGDLLVVNTSALLAALNSPGVISRRRSLSRPRIGPTTGTSAG